MSRNLLLSWSDLQQARQAALSRAAADIAIFDRDLSRFPLGSREIDGILRQLLSSNPNARLRIALHDSARATTTQPRLLPLLQRFGHTIAIRETPENLRQLADQMLIVDSRHAVIHFQFDQPRGSVIADDPDEIQPYLRRFEELWAECGPPISATSLGL